MIAQVRTNGRGHARDQRWRGHSNDGSRRSRTSSRQGASIRDVAEVRDSANYTPIDNRNQITQLEFRAANRRRPYLRLTHNWLLNTSANVDSELTLDGLWIGATGAFSDPVDR